MRLHEVRIPTLSELRTAAVLAGIAAGWAATPAAVRAQAAGGGSGGHAVGRQVAGATCGADEMAMLDPERRRQREMLRERTEVFERRRVDTVVMRTQTRALEAEARARVEAARAGLAFELSRAPSGWLGIGMSGTSVMWMTEEGRVIRYCGYPEVVTVEPGSPAQKAGIVAGDTVVAYNGRYLTSGPVQLDKLLVPGSKLSVRVRQHGKSHERRVTIGERPVSVALAPNVSGRVFINVAPTPPNSPQPAARPLRLPSAIVYSPGVGIGQAAMAGAQLIAMDEELSESLGRDRGLLVVKVAPGSPAAEAGLRAGDVIRSANKENLVSTATLYRIIQAAAAERSVQLELQRDRKKKELLLRW